MTADPSRSEQVVADFKKRKLARSALHRIHSLIQDYEHDHANDRRLACVGIVIIMLLIAVGLYLLFGMESVVVS